MLCRFCRNAGVAAILVVLPCFAPLAQLAPNADQALAGDEIVVAAVTTRAVAQPPEGGDVAGAIRAYIEVAKGGRLLARPVRVIAFADDCRASTAATIAGEIVARGAHVVIGHVCSAAAISAAPIYTRHGILMITPGARSPRLTDQRAGPGIYRLAGRDDRFGADTAAFVAKRFARGRVAIVNDLSVQARGLAAAVDRELKARNISPVLRATYIAGEREYNAVVDKLAASEADVIVIPAQPVEAGIIIEGLRARRLQATLIGSEILAVPDMEPAARRLGDALIVMLPAQALRAPRAGRATLASTNESPNDSRIERASEKSVDTSNETSIAAASQAAIEAWAFAVERAGSLDIAAVTRVLETEQAPTAIGPIRFDVNGDAVLASYAAHAWREYRSQENHETSKTGGWQALPD